MRARHARPHSSSTRTAGRTVPVRRHALVCTMSAARTTPYDMVFGDAPFESEWFPAIAEEAATRAVDALDPARFVMLGATGSLIREILGEEDSGSAAPQFGRLLYHAFHFWHEGAHT